jgi:hypothetical protein
MKVHQIQGLMPGWHRPSTSPACTATAPGPC